MLVIFIAVGVARLPNPKVPSKKTTSMLGPEARSRTSLGLFGAPGHCTMLSHARLDHMYTRAHLMIRQVRLASLRKARSAGSQLKAAKMAPRRLKLLLPVLVPGADLNIYIFFCRP